MIEYNIRKLVVEIISILELEKTRKLTDKESNHLSFLRSCLKEILRNFKLNEFLKILYREKLEKEELEEIEKIKEKEIQDINIFLSIYSCINSEIFFKTWREYKKLMLLEEEQKKEEEITQTTTTTTITTPPELDLTPPKTSKKFDIK